MLLRNFFTKMIKEPQLAILTSVKLIMDLLLFQAKKPNQT